MINKKIVDEGREYVLITIGRLGTSAPWLGIPVDWAEVSAAKCVVERTIPGVGIIVSQGSHFSGNVIGSGPVYFSVKESENRAMDEVWLNLQPAITETVYVRHIRGKKPLLVKVDGRRGQGVIAR